MENLRYDTSGTWYKGNLHLHTEVSDGRKSLRACAKAYADAGYDFMAFTDHAGRGYDLEKLRGAWAEAREGDWPLLILDGVEFHGADDAGGNYHIVALGDFGDPPIEGGISAIVKHCRQRDCLLVLAHPQLMSQSIDEVQRHAFDGVEVYNHLGLPYGRADGASYWDTALAQDSNTMAFAVDDAHDCGDDARRAGGYTPWCGGWVMVNAASCDRESIWASLKAGNFYASTGPDFQAIEVDETEVRIQTSPVRRAWLMGEPWRGQIMESQGETLLGEAAFERPPDWKYLRLMIEDDHGRRAWSNTLFTRQPAASS